MFKVQRRFSSLPEDLQFNSHLGWDILPNSTLEKHILERESIITGKAGSLVVFDGARLLHRGGMVNSGYRLALQIIFFSMNKITLKKRLKKLLFFFNYIFSLRIRKLYKIEKLINNFDVNITAVDVGASYFPHVKWGIIKRSKSTLWIAIDPNKQNLEYARLWDYKSKIKIVEKAVGIKNEKSILYVTNIDSGSSLLKIQIPFNSKHRVTLNGIFPVKETSIYTSKIDKIFNELGVNDNSLIMKLDIRHRISNSKKLDQIQVQKNFVSSRIRKQYFA